MFLDVDGFLEVKECLILPLNRGLFTARNALCEGRGFKIVLEVIGFLTVMPSDETFTLREDKYQSVLDNDLEPYDLSH